jgi:hypothetical protein
LSSKNPYMLRIFLWLRQLCSFISRVSWSTIKWDFIIALGIFLRAIRLPLFLCVAIITTPNFPSPNVLPITKSSISTFPFFFLMSAIYINLLGGDLESELLVEVGEPTFLNLSSYEYLGCLGV